MWSIDAMIKDKSSGYGWGNGMMYVKGNTGAPAGELSLQYGLYYYVNGKNKKETR